MRISLRVYQHIGIFVENDIRLYQITSMILLMNCMYMAQCAVCHKHQSVQDINNNALVGYI